ncbi:MAG: hypothetical protein MI747_01680 [Desulfobacterales bacterium]|nr:hypothetical protein [Desulfobacterales bacterium]
MKKLILMVAITFFAGSTAYGIENPWTRKLPFKEGVVTYALSGTMKGSETVYVKDYGRTIAAYRSEVTSMFGVSDESRELTLTTPDWVYTVDLSDNTGTKQVNPKKVIQEKFDRLSRSEQKKLIKNSEKLGISMVGEMSGNVERKVAKIMGYKCDKVTLMGVDCYTLTGTDFPMKVSGNMMGMVFTEAVTDIDKGRVSASKFKLPAGVDIHHEIEGDRVVREQIEMMFTAMLAGERPKSPYEQASGDMEEAMKAMQQFQDNGGMENLQKQMQGLFGSGTPSN